MLEGAFSFQDRIGRLRYFLGWLLVLPAALVAGIVMAVMSVAARPGLASLVFFAGLGVALGATAVWYGLSLQARRIRDIGWDPLAVITGWFAFDLLDVLLAAYEPGLALGPHQHGTALGALVNLALGLALLFWPGREGTDAGRLDALPVLASAAGVPAPRAAARTGFGRR